MMSPSSLGSLPHNCVGLDAEEQGSRVRGNSDAGASFITLDDGYLGSKLDEGRSKVR